LIKEYDPQLDIYFKNINIRTSYIVTFFLVLIIMTESPLISSTDMMDYLNFNEEPPEDCQYELAPFIQNYKDEKVVKIHSELKEFVRDNNKYGMKIN
jgi:phage terminase large subunit-like protein